MAKKKNLCFVIMPFSDELKPIYYTIKETVTKLGYNCKRVDEIAGGGNVIRHIVESTEQAVVVIADLTSNNTNVLYELGLAHGLAKHVIMLTQDIKEIPFDLKNYRFVLYDMTFGSERRLSKKITDALHEIDNDSEKKTNPVQDFLPPRVSPEKFKKKEKELLALKEENLKLEVKSQLVEAFFKRISGDEALNLEQIYERFIRELDEKDSITVDIPYPKSKSRTKSATRKKIVFKRVDNP